MCGIIGFISKDPTKDTTSRQKFFVDGMFVGAVRGFDSTGIAYGSLNEDSNIFKRALTSPDFIRTRVFGRVMAEFKQYNYIIGHHRAATKGSITDSTAHPFQFGRYTGVHNGTLYFHNSLPGAGNITVDSEAIYNAFKIENPESVIEQLDGAVALAWHDREENTISLFRNDERPLWYAIDEKNETIYYASEYQMLHWVASRNNIKFKEDVAYNVGEDILLTFPIDNPLDFSKKVVKTKKVQHFNYNKWWSKDYEDESGLVYTNDALDKAKLKKGQQIDFMITNVIEYSSGGGKLVGYCLNDIDLVIESYVDAPQLKLAKEQDKETAILTGTIKYGWDDVKNDEIVIVVDSLAIKSDEPKVKVVSKVSRHCVGPDGKMITVRQFKKLTQDGCAYCTAPILVEDHDKIKWTIQSPAQPFCIECSDISEFQSNMRTH